MRSMVEGASDADESATSNVYEREATSSRVIETGSNVMEGLRERAPGKPTFRRQHPIGPYVLDFYCAKARLAIEIDGASHDMGDRPQRDLRRDDWLREHGITVLRIAARDLGGIDEVADVITRMADEKASPERPLHRPPGGPPPRFAGEDDPEQAASSSPPDKTKTAADLSAAAFISKL